MESEPDDGTDTGRRVKARGRRRTVDSEPVSTRDLIVAAAGREFASRGYEGASFRSIARAAKVDPALVHHYFSEKAGLFAESIGAPIRPDRIVATVLSGPRDRIGENLVRILLTTLDAEGTGRRMVELLRAALGHEFAAAMIRQFVVREILARITAELDADDGGLRATLAGSQLVGVIVVRYGIRVEPMASAAMEDLVRHLGPVVQWHLTGTAPGD
ncbi:MAG: TetR family transcriptional regulator [Actinomycetota bacterium]